MKIRLYLDEDSMSHALVRALRARAVDVETALEAGMIRRPDREHLEFATQRGRVLLTSNVGDFCRLHAEVLAKAGTHCGIIVTRQSERTIGSILRGLLKLIASVPADRMRNRLEFLARWL